MGVANVATVLIKLFFRGMSVANSAKLIAHSANLEHGGVLSFWNDRRGCRVD
jgi:hypothetical protein